MYLLLLSVKFEPDLERNISTGFTGLNDTDIGKITVMRLYQNIALLYILAAVLFLRSIDNLSHLMTKPTKWHVCPAKTWVSLGICPVWSKSLMSTWRNHGSLATHWAHSEDSDQTGQMPRMIWVFVGCTVIFLVLSWCGSFWWVWHFFLSL